MANKLRMQPAVSCCGAFVSCLCWPETLIRRDRCQSAFTVCRCYKIQLKYRLTGNVAANRSR